MKQEDGWVCISRSLFSVTTDMVNCGDNNHCIYGSGRIAVRSLIYCNPRSGELW